MNRWTGAVFLLPLAGLNGYVLCAFGAPWPGQWTWTIDSVTGGTVLTAPLAAAFAAWIALGQSRMEALTASMRRAGLVPLRSAGQAWLWAAGAYAVSAAVAASVTAATDHGGPAPWWVALIGLLVLAVGALSGALAVVLWPHPMAAVLVGPTLFVIGAFGPHPYAMLLRQGPTSGSPTGTEYDPVTWLVQVFMLLGVCVVLVCALRLRSSPPAWTSILGPGTAAVAAVVVLGTALGSSPHQRFRVTDERPDACVGSAPRVCLAPSDRRALKATAAAMEVGFGELRRAGIVLPARYEELLPGYLPPADSGMVFVVDGDSDQRLLAGLLGVATPAACSAWTDPREAPPDGAFDGRDLLVQWLRVRAGHRVDALSPEAEHWLSEAADGGGVTWVSKTFEQLRTCALDQVGLPWVARTRP